MPIEIIHDGLQPLRSDFIKIDSRIRPGKICGIFLHGDEKGSDASLAKLFFLFPTMSVIFIRAQGVRRCYFEIGGIRISFDPNRIYDFEALQQSQRLGFKEANIIYRYLAKPILALLQAFPIVMAFHTNKIATDFTIHKIGGDPSIQDRHNLGDFVAVNNPDDLNGCMEIQNLNVCFLEGNKDLRGSLGRAMAKKRFFCFETKERGTFSETGEFRLDVAETARIQVEMAKKVLAHIKT